MANPASNAYSGEWLLGPVGKTTFTDSEAFKLNISDTGSSLMLTLTDTSYRFDQVSGLPHVFKFAWSNKPIPARVNTTVVMKLSNKELLHVKGSEVRRIQRSNITVGSKGEQIFSPQGVWSKGPANIKDFDPAQGAIYRYEKTATGLRVINSELNEAIWRAVPDQPNVYVGERVVFRDGTDMTPVGMKSWKLTQTGPDSMILIANGGIKYLVRMN